MQYSNKRPQKKIGLTDKDIRHMRNGFVVTNVDADRLYVPNNALNDGVGTEKSSIVFKASN